MGAGVVHGLLNNISNLLALGVLYFLLPARPPRSRYRRPVVMGIGIGIIGIMIMLSRWELVEGLFFDTRSVLLIVSGLFFGVFPTVIATLIMISFRVWQGGVGMYPGVGVIVTTALLGLVWRRIRPNTASPYGWLELYELGVVGHVMMVGWMIALPAGIDWATIRTISLPVLLLYPLATMLLGKLLDLQRFRRMSHAEVKQSERRLQRMLEKSWGILNMIDPSGVTHYVSDSVRSILGYEPDDLLGGQFDDLIHPDDRDFTLQRFEQLARKPGESDHIELRLRHKDGHYVWVESVGTNQLDDPYIRSIVVNTRDLTERVQTRQTYHAMLSASIEGFCIIDMDQRLVEVNNTFCLMHGYSREELIGSSVERIVAEAEAEDILKGLEELKAVQVTRLETYHRHKDGSHIDVEVSLTYQPARGGLVFAFVRDISEKNRYQRELAESELRLRQVFNSMQSGFALHDIILDDEGKPVDYRFLEVNPAFEKLTGLKGDDLIGRRVLDVLPGTEPIWIETYGKVALGGEPQRFENFARELGKHFEVAVYAPTYGRFATIFEDVTERKLTQQALAQERNFLKGITEHSPVGIVQADENGLMSFANQRAVELLGLTESEFEGRTFNAPEWKLTTVDGEAMPDEELPFSIVMRTGKPVFRVEHGIERPDGTRLILSVNAAPLQDEKGESQGVIALLEDITQRYEMEQKHQRVEDELRQAQKMEAVGRLAGGVAHDFNNMLAVMMTTAELALEELDPNSELYQDLTEIRHAAQRSANLTRQLLAFSRKQLIKPQVIELNSTISEQEKMLRRLVGEDLTFEFHPGKELWPVYIDPGQVDQILANLVVNARDAIPGVGTITIETSNVHLDADFIHDDMPIPMGQYVLMVVTDSGVGMERKVLENIFEPFYTTKKTGEGTGLGLSTVYGIVRQNGGAIHAYSEVGHGSTFKIYLPKADMVPSDFTDISETESFSGTETILLVEDEPALLVIAERYLKTLGYQVLPASTPGEALSVARDLHGCVDLLLTDVIMPEMDGRQLQNTLLEFCPAMKTIYMSGYTSNVIANRGVLDPGVDFIQKPYRTKDLGKLVRSVLDTPAKS